jgi:hypothetical protein
MQKSFEQLRLSFKNLSGNFSFDQNKLLKVGLKILLLILSTKGVDIFISLLRILHVSTMQIN